MPLALLDHDEPTFIRVTAKEGRAQPKRVQTRVSEYDLRSQLQLPGAVSSVVCLAKARQIRNVVTRRSKDNGVEYVEGLGAELDAPTFSPERELAEDRGVKIPELG